MNPFSLSSLVFVFINTEGIYKVVRENTFLEEKCRAMADGEHFDIAFPVIIRNNQPNDWEPIRWELIKELRKIVMHYGLASPYTRSLLQTVLQGDPMNPFDIKAVAEMLFTPTQKAIFLSDWREQCDIAAVENLGRNPGDPLLGDGIAQLMGNPPVNKPQLQARLAPEILRQSAELVLKAMLRVPDVGKSVKAFTGVRQAKDEPYMQFIDCLETAVDKQVENDAAKDALLLKLAIENANSNCQKVLCMLKNPTLIDMIEACNRVGSIDYVNENLAGHLAAPLQTAQRLCFSFLG
ncbi:endogenous retrovirus group K member 6 Gag polyprotein-like protein [Amazona aestiva]|uniref:Endogenous retrovirus group K member 6 Gag polyprotein-like protein n=1 Tax=Amazona aestiva TaxID=12930 RepID=A0A0Q3TD35_AMAAE|nr:endogenous retrovirus group K member 6 Gag polyprotein-like protein [Amazona aestiva]